MQRFAIAVLLAGLVACSSSPSPVLPPAELLPLENAFAIRPLWSAKYGDGARDQYLTLSPALMNNRGYVVDVTGMVSAFDVESGKLLWQRHSGVAISSSPTVTSSNIYVGSSQGLVLALDTLSGEARWQSRVSSEVLAAPQESKGVVVVRCVDGNVYGLNAANGQRLWVAEQRTPALTLRGTSAPIIAGDIVLAGYDSGKMVAYSLQSGKLLWQATVAASQGRTDLERMIDIDGDPVVIDDVVYVVAYQGRLAALQLASGRILWTRDLDSYAGMSVDAYRIYLSGTDGTLWALDRNNGATLWKQDALIRRALTRPQLHKQYLIVGDFNGFIHWLRRDTGKLVARATVLQRVAPDDVVDENDTRFAKRHSIFAMPLVTDNRVVTVDRRNNATAFAVAYP